MGTSRDETRRQAERDRAFPPRTATAREQGAAVAAARTPAVDWRPQLAERFGIDGARTPSELDGVDPGEPDRYDLSDVQFAHALHHVPLRLLAADEVKLLLDYGYDRPSVFRLALLLVEADPLLEVEGAAFGALLPAAAASVCWDYDPVHDAAALRDDEARFRREALSGLLQRMDDGDIRRRACAALERPRRFAAADATVPVLRRRDGTGEVISRSTPQRGGTPQPTALRFYIVGRADAARLWAMAVDRKGRPIAERAAFLPSGLEKAKAMMQNLFGVGRDAWSDFDGSHAQF